MPTGAGSAAAAVSPAWSWGRAGHELVLGVEIELFDGPAMRRATQTYPCALRT